MPLPVAQGQKGAWSSCAWALPQSSAEAPMLALSTGSAVEMLQVQLTGSHKPTLVALASLPLLSSPTSIYQLIPVHRPTSKRQHSSILAALCAAETGFGDQLLSWTSSASGGGFRPRAGRSIAEGPWALDLQCRLACIQAADGEVCDLVAGDQHGNVHLISLSGGPSSAPSPAVIGTISCTGGGPMTACAWGHGVLLLALCTSEGDLSVLLLSRENKLKMPSVDSNALLQSEPSAAALRHLTAILQSHAIESSDSMLAPSSIQSPQLATTSSPILRLDKSKATGQQSSAGVGHPVVQLAAVLARGDAAVPGSSACDLEALDIAGQQALLSIQLAALQTGNSVVEAEAESWAQSVGHLAPAVTMHAVFHAAMSESKIALLAAALRWVKLEQLQETGAAGEPREVFDFRGNKTLDLGFGPSPAAQAPPQGLTWRALKAVGAGFWLTEDVLLRSKAEELAKAQYAVRKDPADAALMYVALGKKLLLQGLFRTAMLQKQADFLQRDFDRHPQHREAACKNAYVLLAQHRHEMAAAFFILGGALEDAVGVCAHEMQDVQLALVVARLLSSPSHPDLANHILEEQLQGPSLHTDIWAAPALHWLAGCPDKATTTLLSQPGNSRKTSEASSGMGLSIRRSAQLGMAAATSAPVFGEGHALFSVEGDKALAICACLSGDHGGGDAEFRPFAASTAHHGIIEGEAAPLLPAFPASPSDARSLATSESGTLKGSVFSAVLGELLDAVRWPATPVADSPRGSPKPSRIPSQSLGSMGASPAAVSARRESIATATLAAHPYRPLYLSGSSTGEVFLLRFGQDTAVSGYTPMASSGAAPSGGSSGSVFSGPLRSWHLAPGVPASQWGQPQAVQFSECGERFAGIGEGGVVATWRLDAPRFAASDTGPLGRADWCHQAMSKRGVEVAYVGNSSSILAVGGLCPRWGNVTIWDTLAPVSTGPVARLVHHSALVTALQVLPGGRILATADETGMVAAVDIRMLESSGGGAPAQQPSPKALLWRCRQEGGGVSCLEAGIRPATGLPILVAGTRGGSLHALAPDTGALLQSVLPVSRGLPRPKSRGLFSSSHAPQAPTLTAKHAVCDPPLPKVSGKEIVQQLTKLATYTDDPNPAVTRVLFTGTDLSARGYIKQLMQDAGLGIREDAMGNIFGRLEGSSPGAGAVVTGSHCDAIPLAGMYDGTVGVVGAIAALAGLSKASFKPKRPIEALMFTSEEPTRFGLGCIGSRGMAGVLTPATLDAKLDENGTSFAEAAKAAGYGGKHHKDILKSTKVGDGKIAAFVELHIEQGPLLEREGVRLGIVTAIAAPAALRVTLSGDGGHAGALLMPDRHDAGLAGSELALHVEKAVLAAGAVDTVGTTGGFRISPNTVNSVPREATLDIDIRDIDKSRRDAVVDSVKKAVSDIAKKRGVRWTFDVVNQDPPATCDDKVVQAAAASAHQLGVKPKHMVSRAYHDSLFMAQIAPSGMIFIPCRGGWSHRPDEFASPEDIELGVQALGLTLARLAESSSDDLRTEL
ncbi:hypothetical protein WJX73_002530 [Symbiochloris irregularis]|uniref:RAVE complex protein Rav1 C-terminal domain-containing protein n=1 Tax=Symbiochloris irregularis TaxID=706552 RepID=A0AAW1NWI1_9CHLO